MNQQYIKTDEYSGPERRSLPLSEDQIESIAERAAERAIERLKAGAYQGIGQWAVGKFFWIAGLVSVAIYWWLLKNGLIKP
jgi:hypothetical protein